MKKFALAIAASAILSGAAVAADAGRLHAAERRRQMPHVLRVDPDHAGFETLREALCKVG